MCHFRASLRSLSPVKNKAICGMQTHYDIPLHDITAYKYVFDSASFASFSVSYHWVVRFLMYDVICGYSCKWSLERPYQKRWPLVWRVTSLHIRGFQHSLSSASLTMEVVYPRFLDSGRMNAVK